jgi:uncharacterized protein (UPF0548 family)
MSTFRLFAPDAARVSRVLEASRAAPLSYSPVGSPSVPPGWFSNRGSTELGRGKAVFERASAALRAWIHFDLGWVSAAPGGSLAPGALVAVVSRTFGLYTVNVAKILTVSDEPRRFAFTYGTTTHHVERGEETFSITWHPDDRVTYEVWSYSKPAHPLVRLFAPLARMLQRRFIRDSCARVRRECDAKLP